MPSDESGVDTAYSAFDNDTLPEDDSPSLADRMNFYIIDGALYVVFRDRLWRRTGQTYNPRVIAQVDAVGWEGELLTVHSDGKTIDLQHHMAGIELTLDAAERTRYCFVTFEEVDSIGWETPQETGP